MRRTGRVTPPPLVTRHGVRPALDPSLQWEPTTTALATVVASVRAFVTHPRGGCTAVSANPGQPTFDVACSACDDDPSSPRRAPSGQRPVNLPSQGHSGSSLPDGPSLRTFSARITPEVTGPFNGRPDTRRTDYAAEDSRDGDRYWGSGAGGGRWGRCTSAAQNISICVELGVSDRLCGCVFACGVFVVASVVDDGLSFVSGALRVRLS